MLELNDEAAEQTVEAKVVDLLQGQEGFRWKVKNRTDYSLCLFIFLQWHAAAVDIMKDGSDHCNPYVLGPALWNFFQDELCKVL